MDLALRLHNIGFVGLLVSAVALVLTPDGLAGMALGWLIIWSLGAFLVVLSIAVILMAWRGGELSKWRLLSILPVFVIYLFYVLDQALGAMAQPDINGWGLLVLITCWIGSIIVMKKKWGTHRRRMFFVVGLCLFGILAYSYREIDSIFASLIDPWYWGLMLATTAPLLLLFFFYPAWCNLGGRANDVLGQGGEEDREDEDEEIESTVGAKA